MRDSVTQITNNSRDHAICHVKSVRLHHGCSFVLGRCGPNNKMPDLLGNAYKSQDFTLLALILSNVPR